MTLRDIVVRGAREHNLKGVDVTIPRLALTTITGVSGSGKSSLAFDTIYQEGQRRYVESLSTYARQFLGRMEKPRVDRIDGLSPALLIDQRTAGRNPRSTVGTITEILDHLRLLWARLGTPLCPECGAEVAGRTRDAIVEQLLRDHAGRRVTVLAPVVRDRKGHYRKDVEGWRLKGYTRAWFDGVEHRLDQAPALDRRRRHSIELVIDRIALDESKHGRLAEAVEGACALADGMMHARVDGGEALAFSTRSTCPNGHGAFPELEPRLFSFNSPHGACPDCDGLGYTRRPDESLVVGDESRSIREGALRIMNKGGYLSYVRLGPRRLEAVAEAFDIDLDAPWRDLPRRARDVLMRGSGEREVTLEFDWSARDGAKSVRGRDTRPFPGILPAIARCVGRPGYRHAERFLASRTCESCGGSRLNAAARSVRFDGRSLDAVAALTIDAAAAWLATLQLKGRDAAVGGAIQKELAARLGFLQAVGVGYLGLDRGARTLSGGESQRVRLASQVGSGLQGVLYVLDEPSIGLHPRDNRRLIETLAALRDRGNTVVVVEHDADMIMASDAMVDIGPGAGREGGEILADGPVAASLRGRRTLTTDYLSGRRGIELPASRRAGSGEWLVVRGARQHNLRDIDVRFPLGCLTVVTGVSGSGKSTLVDEVLRRALARRLHRASAVPGDHDGVDGVEHLDKVVEIDQLPIGRTPRSNPATYTGVMDHVRDVFAGTPEARMRGYRKGRFSFNVKGGRCEECQGAGVKTIEMQFLPDVIVNCDVCVGRRYNAETLEVVHRGKAIDEVLAMTIVEALEFFRNHARIARILQMLVDVGLGYMALGQPSTTLSGGEAQRVKLASELCRPPTGRTLYILDEPTTGLHMEDIRVLLGALGRLVDAGNSMIVVEHNLDVIKVADWVVDLGPEGGSQGGEVVAAGPPEAIAEEECSHTGRALRPVLTGARRRPGGRRRAARRPVSGDDLVVRGASLHNLKHVDVTVPHGSLTVITGVSGSGKTSLAFDTLFAEGQRRFVESLSTYARRFLERMERPPVDAISGLSPAIAIDQRTAPRNPRSTVSTSTEVHDFLRLLFARVGRPHCHACGKALLAWSPSRAAADLVDRARGRRATITAPLFHGDECHPTTFSSAASVAAALGELLSDGYVRLRVDGAEVRIGDAGDLAGAASIELVVDRTAVDGRRRTRLAEALAQAQRRGLGLARVHLDDGGTLDYEVRPTCPRAGSLVPGALEPRQFSFNSPAGACPACDGLGRRMVVDPERLIDRPDRPLLAGAMTSRVGAFLGREGGWHAQVLAQLAEGHGTDLGRPWREQPAPWRRAVLEGAASGRTVEVSFERKGRGRQRRYEYQVEWQGLLAVVEGWWRNTASEGWWRAALEDLMLEGPCPACHGGRLRPESLAVTVAGRNIQQVEALTVDQAREFFLSLELQGEERAIAHDAVTEVGNRLEFLVRVGLGYLTLDRAASSLSGGEAQRIRLASQLGNRLVGVLYVLDEPSIGLHPRDQRRLLDTLAELRDLGNTIVVVEHDRDTMQAADHLIDLGPGAGEGGGTVVAAGAPATVARSRESLTGQYLAGRRAVPVPERRRGSRRHLTLRRATRHNLRDVTVRFPVGALTVVTGVSGSGKSTLVGELLVPAVEAALDGDGRRGLPAGLGSLAGVGAFDKLLVIDQSPLGRSPNSNAATYTGAMDELRMVFANTPEARMRGFGPGRFSVNVAGGRCEACQGRGVEVIEMHFLSDVEVRCEACRGRRFGRDTLEVRYKGHSIADVLDMEVGRALEVFSHHSGVRRKLAMLERVGLGYLKLGQPATTLSGGEAQRVKLAAELGRPGTGRSLVVLDEPTTGLHFEDVARLVAVLQDLVDQGNTVVVIEHNVDVIKNADWIVDLGPEGGAAGGSVVVADTPEAVAAHPRSHTGRCLAAALDEVAA